LPTLTNWTHGQLNVGQLPLPQLGGNSSAMTRWCRIAVLLVIGFYAIAGGVIPSPLAVAGSNCVMASGPSGDGPLGCDGGCPATLCATVPYAVPAQARDVDPRAVQYVVYAPRPPDRLTALAPAPAFRPPNA